MKKVFFFTIAIICANSFAADPTQTTMDPKKQEMMKKWMDFATPGAAHKELESMAGDWNYASTFWESAKEGPMKSTGKSTFTMILGNRYLQQTFKGEAMGQPFEGLGFIGYNNLEKKYESIWMDNMGTGIMKGVGTYDAKTKTIKESGKMSCPMTADKMQKYRSEWKMTDKNNMQFTMWAPDLETGKEFKNMEIVYKRAM